MNLTARMRKLAGLVYPRERDPRRAERTWRAYDEGRHYAAYLERCRAAFERTPAARAADELSEHGFTYLRVLEPDKAQVIGDELRSRHELQRLKKDSKHLEGFRVTDRQWLEGLLAAVLQGAADEAIAGFFRSEYLVHWVALSLTRPAREQDSVSFRWHCDKGPSAHLKLIVYLNPTGAHGGNTEFIDLADTAAVARRGYLFGWSKTRTADAGRLARLAGRELATHVRAMDAGQAVLFQPARVLHRGISPLHGPRLTATLCLLPSPVDWRRAWQCETLSDLAVDEKWHADALRFLADFEQRLRAG